MKNLKEVDIKGAVYLVEDDLSTQEVLITLFESVNMKVYSFPNSHLFLDHCENIGLHDISCVVLDIRLPCVSGLEVFKILKNKSYHHPVIFITAHGTISMAVEVMKKGAFDFISKPFNNQHLIDTVQQAFLHIKELQPFIRLNKKKELLSSREQQILAHLLEGKKNKEISFKLNISTSTVEAHRSNILEKLEISTITELFKYCSLSLFNTINDK